jgi:hypothetical protein
MYGKNGLFALGFCLSAACAGSLPTPASAPPTELTTYELEVVNPAPSPGFAVTCGAVYTTKPDGTVVMLPLVADERNHFVISVPAGTRTFALQYSERGNCLAVDYCDELRLFQREGGQRVEKDVYMESPGAVVGNEVAQQNYQRVVNAMQKNGRSPHNCMYVAAN